MVCLCARQNQPQISEYILSSSEKQRSENSPISPLVKRILPRKFSRSNLLSNYMHSYHHSCVHLYIFIYVSICYFSSFYTISSFTHLLYVLPIFCVWMTCGVTVITLASTRNLKTEGVQCFRIGSLFHPVHQVPAASLHLLGGRRNSPRLTIYIKPQACTEPPDCWWGPGKDPPNHHN